MKDEANVIDDSEDEEIILSELPDDELVEQMHDDLYDGLKEEIEEGTNILLDRGWDANKVLNEALVEGMRIVGIDFRDGILFVPEVLLAANAMKGGMAILRPLLAETGVKPIGKMVIGLLPHVVKRVVTQQFFRPVNQSRYMRFLVARGSISGQPVQQLRGSRRDDTRHVDRCRDFADVGAPVARLRKC